MTQSVGGHRVGIELGGVAGVALLLVLLPPALAAPTVGWRGNWTGVFPSATPCTDWAADKNVIWSTPMSAWSNSTPAIVGDRLFVCAEPFTLLCVRLSDGEILWERTHSYENLVTPQEASTIAEQRRRAEELAGQLRSIQRELRDLRTQLQDEPDNADLKQRIADLEARQQAIQAELQPLTEAWYQLPPIHEVTGYSTPTPTSDGSHVYALFGNGVAACYDLDGNRKWAYLLEKPAHGWGHSASPLLVGGKLIVHIQHLMAIDPETGTVLWYKRLRESWGSPVSMQLGSLQVILTPAGDAVRLSDGEVLATGIGFLDYASPIVNGDVVYYIQSGGAAVRLAQEGDGITTDTLWRTYPRADRYYGSAVFHNGLIFANTQASVLSTIDAATGAVLSERELNLGGTAYPSLQVAGGLLFVSSDNGATAVLRPGPEPQEIARNFLPAFRSTPVFEGSRMYVRTFDKLFCIGAEG